MSLSRSTPQKQLHFECVLPFIWLRKPYISNTNRNENLRTTGQLTKLIYLEIDVGALGIHLNLKKQPLIY